MSQAAIIDAQPQRRARLTRARPSISVFGLGYVGAVSAACLTQLGCRVHGVDPDPRKTEMIGQGRSPIVEAELEDLLTAGVRAGLLSASQDARRAVLETDVSFVSVGTPSAADGSCDLRFIRIVAQQIGAALAEKSGFHVIALRCSAPPGVTREVFIPIIEAVSAKRCGADFGVCFNPEFLREGVAVADFRAPPKTVIGASDPRSAAMLARIYQPVDDRPLITEIEVAEMVKYTDNVWHATKVAFANEVGRICRPLGVDSHSVMDIFVKDEKLNLSPYYLKPGFAFGGSCLPKEVRAVARLSRDLGVAAPLIESLLESNDAHIDLAEEMVLDSGARRVGVLGVTFKPDTDDIRESPYLELAARLDRRGVEVVVYDGNLVFDGRLDGQTAYVAAAHPELAEFVEKLPSIASDRPAEILRDCDLLVASHATDDIRWIAAHRARGCGLIDLARLWPSPESQADYAGIGW